MGNWSDYKREETERLAPGAYRVEIVSAEEKVSQSGNPMIVVGIKPNGTNMVIKDFFVKGEWFNRKITGFFDGFPEIEDGDFNLLGWVGCVGAAKLKQDGDFLKVHYYLNPDQAEKLPPWTGKRPERQTVTQLDEGMTEISPDDDLPF